MGYYVHPMLNILHSFRLHIGDSGTIYHVDDCCLSYPDSAKKVLSICQVCNNSSSAFEIGRSLFVSEQGQKFHLARYCRTFKNLPVTEYRMCSACGTAGDTMRGSVLRMRNTLSSFSSATELS